MSITLGVIIGLVALALGIWAGATLMWRVLGQVTLAYIDAAQASGANSQRFASRLAADERLPAPLRRVWEEKPSGS